MAGTGLELKTLFGASILSLPTLDPHQQKLSRRRTVEAMFIESVCSVHPDSTVLPVPAALTVEVDVSALWEGSRRLP